MESARSLRSDHVYQSAFVVKGIYANHQTTRGKIPDGDYEGVFKNL